MTIRKRRKYSVEGSPWSTGKPFRTEKNVICIYMTYIVFIHTSPRFFPSTQPTDVQIRAHLAVCFRGSPWPRCKNPLLYLKRVLKRSTAKLLSEVVGEGKMKSLGLGDRLERYTQLS